VRGTPRQTGQSAQVRDINDLVTLNLDIVQFAQDVIRNCDSPELLRAFWHALETMSVLDPTVGSGAFLFAALNILKPLYEACLERMEAFVGDLDRSGENIARRNSPTSGPCWSAWTPTRTLITSS
jgi:hypothetical protein